MQTTRIRMIESIATAITLHVGACNEAPTPVADGGEESSSTTPDPATTEASADSSDAATTQDTSSTMDTSSTGGARTSASDTESTGALHCLDDSDCDDELSCTVDGCADGGCVHLPIDGTDAPEDNQVAGDCTNVRCNAGRAINETDDTDVPVDDNECTADACSGGIPSNEPVASGAPCEADGVCDGEGVCVGCNEPEDCDELPADDDCRTRTCEAGACGEIFTSPGTPVSATMQSSGDCQTVVCDGAGGTESIDDDGDLPVDGLECTEDLCEDGMPDNPPLATGTDCSAGVCDGDGGCVGCNVPEDCDGTDSFCQSRTCVGNTCGVENTADGTALPAESQTAGDCQELHCDGVGQTEVVVVAEDVPSDDGSDCTIEECNGAMPMHTPVTAGMACSSSGGNVCDASGACIVADCQSISWNAGQIPSANITYPSAWTMELWMMVPALPSAWGAVAGVDALEVCPSNPNNTQWIIIVDPDGTLRSELGASFSSGPSAADVVLGEWMHVALQYHGDGTGSFYVDGVLVQTHSGGAPQWSAVCPLRLGNIQGSESHLLAAGAAAVRHSDLRRYVADFVPSPVLEVDADTLFLYAFDEGAGGTATDEVAGASMTLNGAAWVDDGPNCPGP